MTSPERTAASRRALVRSGVAKTLSEAGSERGRVRVDGLSTELRRFLCARLREDLDALRRRATSTTPVDDRTRAHHDRAVTMTAATLADLEAHRPVERWTVRIMLLGYCGHPEFRHEWITDTD